MPWTPPESAKTFGFRPLSSGMVLSQPSQAAPEGSFLILQNFVANLEGPRKRPGYDSFAGEDTLPYDPVDVMTAVNSNGVSVTLVLTRKTLFTVDPRVGFTEVAWGYSTGTITVSGASVTGSGTSWSSQNLSAGDLIRVGTEEASIVSVNSDTSITIASGSLTNGAGLSYSIQRTFSPSYLNSPTWCKTVDRIAIADGKHELISYDIDAGTMDLWTTDPAKEPPNGAVIPSVVAFAGDRVFQANIVDPVDGVVSSRILWSTLADETDFSFPENYTDIPYSGGDIIRLLGLQDNLVVYFDNAVYMGYPTNYPTLPFRFVSLDTSNLGLVAPYAVTSWFGGHFYVSQNGIYFLNKESTKLISSNIHKLLKLNLSDSGNSYAVADPENRSIMFGISDASGYISRIWRFDPETQGWSYDTTTTLCMANPQVSSSNTWDSSSGTWDSPGYSTPTWNGVRIDDTQRRVIVESGMKLWRSSAAAPLDFNTEVIATIIETVDHDFGDIDGLKVFTRFGIKIDSPAPRSGPLVFNVSVSSNRGYTYRSVGPLTIPSAKDEGYVNFRVTGSTLRVKLESALQIQEYSVSEYSIRVIGFGEELDVSTH